MGEPIIRVTVEDLERGDVEKAEIVAGDYVIVCAAPLELANVQLYANGTKVLTLKRGDPSRSQAWKHDPTADAP